MSWYFSGISDYERYRSRVVTDGGNVNNPTYTQSAIAKAKELGIWNTTLKHWSSPSFGVKHTANSIEKAYSITGVADAVQSVSGSRPVLSAGDGYSPPNHTGEYVAYYDNGDFLTLESGMTADPSRLTMVSFWNVTTVQGLIYAHRNEATRLIQFTSGSALNALFQLRGSGNNIQTLTTSHGNAGEWQSSWGIFNKVADSHRFRLNTGTIQTNATDFGVETFTSTKQTIGAQEVTPGSPGNAWVGYIADVVVVEDDISNTTADALAAFIRAFYFP